jgi:hypothetical protein
VKGNLFLPLIFEEEEEKERNFQRENEERTQVQ